PGSDRRAGSVAAFTQVVAATVLGGGGQRRAKEAWRDRSLRARLRTGSGSDPSRAWRTRMAGPRATLVAVGTLGARAARRGVRRRTPRAGSSCTTPRP